MIVRRAIQLPNNNIRAECPEHGMCRYKQVSQGKLIELSCGYLAEVITNKKGLHVQCRNLNPAHC